MTALPWNIVSSDIALPFSEVHAWSVPVSSEQRLDCLAEDEIKRAATFRDVQAKQQFVTGRISLRQILAGYLGIAPQKIKLSRSARGKLALAAPLENEIHFNLSHSADLVLLAFARNRDVGIDVEKIEYFDDAITIAEKFFSPEEAQMVKREQHPERVFFKYWTRKEAILKCRGEGFDDATAGHCEGFEGRICELQPAPGYAAALAVTGSAFTLQTWQWVIRASQSELLLSGVKPTHLRLSA